MDTVNTNLENLEEPLSKPSKTKIRFTGEGAKFFGIAIVNAILTVLTLGLYYPWAKANTRKYLWNETSIKDSRLVFNGTGKEMFKGFVIAYLVLGSFYGLMIWGSQHPDVAIYFILAFYLVILALAPFAIFGAWRYRVSRTSWRGIFIGFDGNMNDFMKMYFKEVLFVIITFGIYAPWMQVKLTNYLFSHTQLGKNRFGFVGDGGTLFGINLLGMFLTYITLGIYFPFFYKNRVNFTIDNTYVDNGEEKKRMHSTLTGNESFKTLALNLLLIIVTFGLAFPWVLMRNMKMVLENVEIPENLDFDNLEQSENTYNSATGDEMSDILDIGLDF